MEGPFSKSVLERFPSVIKALDETCQQTYICLRLRKNEIETAKQLNLSIADAREKIETVRSELIKAGQLDLIEDPRFISIHAEDPDAQEMPLTAGDLDIDNKLIIKEFLSHLRETVDKLPVHQVNLLKLRYKHQMAAKDILGFCRHIGSSLIPGKDLSGLNEQDIFYAVNTALKEVFKGLKTRYGGAGSLGMENLKYIFEEIGL